ncbi:MAG: 23S rRNA (guanosine(2251)-2'-O)-methyltransferase RlmB [Acidobacteria bacterium]|nr:23S rRNA (guanosine(2251)-2'-O)-methyltransferase RlmB [Acidobacteriota bacterium]
MLGDRPRRPLKPGAGRPPGGRAGSSRQPPDARRPAPERGLGGEQVEGRQAVRELLLAGRRRVKEVVLADDLDPAPIIEEIEELAAESRTRVRRVPRATLEGQARSEAPQGVLAKAAPLRDADLDTLCRRGRDGQPPFLLALDGITDPQNLGALLRTAECAGVSGVLLPRHRAAHVTPTVAKAAAGAIEHLDIALVSGMPAALARAKELGVWVVGLDEAGEAPLFGLAVADQPLALVLGAEGSGLGRLTRARCDLLVAIPIRGRLASLNVASAGALACYEVTRRRA